MIEEEIIAAIEQLLETQGRSHCMIDRVELEQLIIQVIAEHEAKVKSTLN